MTAEQKERFFQEHKRILSLNEDPIDCSSVSIKETTKKRTYGVCTDSYDWVCNSAGQDNLSQILLAVMSFEVLRDRRGDAWNGGLLLIDELDATLHPAAQIKLVKYLYDSAERLGIQVVFTTHSLSLLEFVCTRCQHNSHEHQNGYELVYLTTRNRFMELIANPSYEAVYNDMLNTMSLLRPEIRRIAVYTEDAEARWFLTRLAADYLPRLKLVEICMGSTAFLGLLKQDYDHFTDTILVLDGDVREEDIASELGVCRRAGNVIVLPGGRRPESVFHDYLDNLPEEHEAYEQLAATTGWSKRVMSEYTPSRGNDLREREWFKEWFKDFFPVIDLIYPYWATDNEAVVRRFIARFVRAFNAAARRKGLPGITE